MTVFVVNLLTNVVIIYFNFQIHEGSCVFQVFALFNY